MTRSAVIAAAYMLALTQGGAMLSGSRVIGPREYIKPDEESHDAERIAKAEAKRARKAARRRAQG